MRHVIKAFAIKLTPKESCLLPEIDFDPGSRRPAKQSWPDSTDAVEQLMQLLLTRNAIPEARLKYFTDAECNVGGHGLSREQTIARNGGKIPVLRNPAFVRYLRYFLYGPNLPEQVVDAFRQKIVECGQPFTGSDAIALGTLARQLARVNQLDFSAAPEEFFKLTLECGLDAGDARIVRDAVMKIRR